MIKLSKAYTVYFQYWLQPYWFDSTIHFLWNFELIELNFELMSELTSQAAEDQTRIHTQYTHTH